MKKIFFIVILLLAINTFGQKLTGKVPGLTITNQGTVTENDTIIKVIYKNKIENKKDPAYFINGKLVNKSFLGIINPKQIATVKVEKEDIEIEGVKYFGKLIIETKNNYNLKLISLNNLKLKYTSLKENSTIFIVDNVIINEDYNGFMVDENYILKITIGNFENKNENLKLNIIEIFTRSDKNIEDANTMIIR